MKHLLDQCYVTISSFITAKTRSQDIRTPAFLFSRDHILSHYTLYTSKQKLGVVVSIFLSIAYHAKQ